MHVYSWLVRNAPMSSTASSNSWAATTLPWTLTDVEKERASQVVIYNDGVLSFTVTMAGKQQTLSTHDVTQKRR
ncbi:hypothetical protein CF335_g8989 [Tilletia laevis]|nr:hypothetical protein CF335_g8989 [Tilletia laevis]